MENSDFDIQVRTKKEEIGRVPFASFIIPKLLVQVAPLQLSSERMKAYVKILPPKCTDSQLKYTRSLINFLEKMQNGPSKHSAA